MTLDLAAVTLSVELLSRFCVGNCKVYEVDTRQEYLLGGENIFNIYIQCDPDLNFDFVVVTLTFVQTIA